MTLPTPGVVGGRPRRQPLVDTEVIVAALAVPGEIQMYNNFGAFRAAPVSAIPTAKVFGRDVTLRGTSGTLPQNTYFYWFMWRFKFKTYLANLGSAGNVVVSEEIHRLRGLGSVSFNFQQTQLMNFPLDELPDGVGSEYINTTHAGATVFSLVNGVADRRNAKDVSVGGKPTGIDALQSFGVTVRFDNSTGLVPTIDYFPQSVMEGILVQGITG
jgi:hypothetical protein